MRNDHLSYRRATSISVIGLAIQAVLGVALLIYALLSADQPALTGAIYIVLGVIVWLGLALVFHQHTLERLEAMEVDALDTEAGARASVFDESAEDLRVAGRRLQWMQRFLLPGVSLVYGGAVVAVGAVRLIQGREALDPDAVVASPAIGWAVAIGLAVGAAGFVFARFVAGMAKQRVWGTLRGGAAIAAGASLVGVLVAVAHFIEFLGNPAALRWLHVAMPVALIVLGAEVFLNFVLNLYRPRRKGEAPPPAFESRILGFLAAPDRLAESVGEAISYQFGFDVTESWFYRLLSRVVGLLAIAGALILWLLTSVAIVRPEEQGLVLRFGALQREVGPGPHLKYPWPIETLETYPASAITLLEAGKDAPEEGEPILWTGDHQHGGPEPLLIVRSDDAAGGDFSLLAVQAPVHFRVTDMAKYDLLAAPGQRNELLRAVAQRTLMEFLATRSMRDVLGHARGQIGEEFEAEVQAAFDRMDAGVEVLFAGIAGAHPPTDDNVAQAFEQVTSEDIRREAAIESAEADRIRTLTGAVASVELFEEIIRELDRLETMTAAGEDEQAVIEQEFAIEQLLRRAGGRAAEMILTARADRWERHMAERGRVARQEGRVALYRAAPRVYLASLYFDALRVMAQDARVFINAFPDSDIRFDTTEADTATDLSRNVVPRTSGGG